MNVNETLSGSTGIAIDVRASKKHVRIIKPKEAAKFAHSILSLVEDVTQPKPKSPPPPVVTLRSFEAWYKKHGETWEQWQDKDGLQKDIIIAEQVLGYYFHGVEWNVDDMHTGTEGTWVQDTDKGTYAVSWAWGETKALTVQPYLHRRKMGIEAQLSARYDNRWLDKAECIGKYLAGDDDANEATVFVYWVMINE